MGDVPDRYGPDLADVDDADLVLALDREPRAVEEFYRRHVRALIRYALRRLDDTHAAADLVAATFLAAIESAHRYDPRRGEPVGWLYGIANKLILGQHRRAAAERRAVDRLAGQRALDPDEYGRAEDAIDAGRRAGATAEALDALPSAERELLVLVLHESLTVGEAAAALGIRQGTARMRLARARARLAPRLALRLSPGPRSDCEPRSDPAPRLEPGPPPDLARRPDLGRGSERAPQSAPGLRSDLAPPPDPAFRTDQRRGGV